MSGCLLNQEIFCIKQVRRHKRERNLKVTELSQFSHRNQKFLMGACFCHLYPSYILPNYKLLLYLFHHCGKYLSRRN